LLADAVVDIGVTVRVGLTLEAEVPATSETLADEIRLDGLVLEVENAIVLLIDGLFVLLIALKIKIINKSRNFLSIKEID
jgi:hypothetical protein